MVSKVARKPIELPAGVEVNLQGQEVKIKGKKGEASLSLNKSVSINIENNQLMVSANDGFSEGNTFAGTTRALLSNHVVGVSDGFTKKLKLVGVGYRAVSGKKKDLHKLDLTLGLSHPVEFVAPKGVELTTPSATDIEVTGIDKQLVGQVAADIRAICKGVRRPEPYKGKGIRYADEHIILKETKKK